MSVVLAVEEVGPCRKQLKIEVPVPAVEAETERITAEFGKKAKIPGFRKGKVPAAMVKRHYGPDIRQEVLERLVPRYWRQAAAEKGIEALLPPEVRDVHLHDGEALTFVATVEVRPEIELRNFQDFALPDPPVEPTPEEVAGALTDLRRGHATWSAVERAAAVGDKARLEIAEIGPEGPGPFGPAELEVGNPRFWDELSAAVTGLSAGQIGRFVRREGEGEAAIDRSYEARVVEVQEARLPELDAEFAAHFGKYGSVAELETDVTRRIRSAKQQNARQTRETALLDQLTERHVFPLPEGVVHHEIEELLKDYAEGLSRQGVDLEKAGIDWPKMGEEARPHAERRVRARLLLDAISDREGVEVGEQEFEQALALLARTQGVATHALRHRLDETGQLTGLRARMRRDKMVRRLLGETPAADADSK
jgi:trigger factor